MKKLTFWLILTFLLFLAGAAYAKFIITKKVDINPLTVTIPTQSNTNYKVTIKQILPKVTRQYVINKHVGSVEITVKDLNGNLVIGDIISIEVN